MRLGFELAPRRRGESAPGRRAERRDLTGDMGLEMGLEALLALGAASPGAALAAWAAALEAAALEAAALEAAALEAAARRGGGVPREPTRSSPGAPG